MANRKMRRVGTVVRDANDKTIVVAYAWSQRHRIYKRTRRRITKFVAHDEHNEASIGDRVEIEECRPYSATKRWRLCRVIAQVDVVTGTEAPEAVSESDVPAEEPATEEHDAPSSEAPQETAPTEVEPQVAESTDDVPADESTETDEAAVEDDPQPTEETEADTAATAANEEEQQQ